MAKDFDFRGQPISRLYQLVSRSRMDPTNILGALCPGISP